MKLRKITESEANKDNITLTKYATLITPQTKKQIKQYRAIRSDYLTSQFESKFN